jgi:auxin responsive GH3 family protein
MGKSWQEKEYSAASSDSDADYARSVVLPSRRAIDLAKDPSGLQAQELLEVLAEEGMNIQREKLREILIRNAGVEYLQRHGLGGRTDVESFRECVPVVSYEDLEADLMRVVNGDKSPILTSDRITNFIIRYREY